MPITTRKEKLERWKSDLNLDKSSFVNTWDLLGKFIKPTRVVLDKSDHNRGDRRNKNIINGWATICHAKCRAGMMSGMISQAKPWFSISTEDEGLMEIEEVKAWVNFIRRMIERVLRQSNFYSMTQSALGDLIQFGGGCVSHVDDFENIARFYTHRINSYAFALDHRYRPGTWMREWEWHCDQIIGAFGYENCSPAVQQAYDQSNYKAWFPLTHFVYLNEEYRPDRPFGKNMKYRSCYYETQGAEQLKDKFLRESGFNEFPVYLPRWDVADEDTYATDCPGMTALGDVMSLQTMEREKAKGIQKMVSPPLTGPASLRTQNISALPGGITTYDGEGKNQLRSIYNVNPQVNELRQEGLDIKERFRHYFYNHVFSPITDMPGIQPKNELTLTRMSEEALLELGPVLGRLETEFLNDCLDRVFNQIMRADAGTFTIIPPIPQILMNQQLKFDYTGTLAMAQKRLATGPIERTTGFVTSIIEATQNPEVGDKYDFDQAIDEYAKAVDLPDRIVRSDDAVAAIRATRAEQQAQAQQQAAMNMAADTAGKAGKAIESVSKVAGGQ